MANASYDNLRSSHAVVIGGSMAGMLAARVASEHFDRVTILERDRQSEQAVSRAGTPQARHLHVLLEGGRQIIEQLFPGLSHQLVSEGAWLLDSAADFSILNTAGWAVQFPSGIPMLTCSRDLLDWHVRKRLLANSRIQVEHEVDVIRLEPDLSGRGVCGVAVRRRGQGPLDSSRDCVMHADFVIDASGRGSRAPDWLESLGYGRPMETEVNAHLGYATRLFRRPRHVPVGRQGIFLQAAPPAHNRSGVAVPIEGDRWIVTVSGGSRDYPPTDDAGFLAFVRSLRHPAIYDAIKDAQPLSPIYGYRGLANRLKHYDRLPRWPERFVVLGDALCTFNPVYAQGMTTAALGAITLDRVMRFGGRESAGIARQIQRQLAKAANTPWLLATSQDLRYAATVGKQSTFASRLVHKYMDHVFELITRSERVRDRSLRVFHMLRPPAMLFHPDTLARVLWSATKRCAAALIGSTFRGAAKILQTELSIESAGPAFFPNVHQAESMGRHESPSR